MPSRNYTAGVLCELPPKDAVLFISVDKNLIIGVAFIGVNHVINMVKENKETPNLNQWGFLTESDDVIREHCRCSGGICRW